VNAVAVTENGKSGTIAISFGTEFKDVTEVEIVTTNGTVVWGPTDVKSVARKGTETVEETKTFPYSSGVVAEVAAFAQGIEAGKIDELQTPAEALKDVEVIQRLLESGAGGAAIQSLGA
jgi:predicted dehydrogenase